MASNNEKIKEFFRREKIKKNLKIMLVVFGVIVFLVGMKKLNSMLKTQTHLPSFMFRSSTPTSIPFRNLRW